MVAAKAPRRVSVRAEDTFDVEQAHALEARAEALLAELGGVLPELPSRMRNTRGPKQEQLRSFTRARYPTVYGILEAADAHYDRIRQRNIGVLYRQARAMGRYAAHLSFEQRRALVEQGWMRAYTRWDPTKAANFPTYAAQWARATVQRAPERQSAVTLPAHADKGGGYSVIPTVPLDAPIRANTASTRDGDMGITGLDLLQDEHTPETLLLERESTDRRAHMLHVAVNGQLDKRAITIIRMRFYENRTLEEVGAYIGVTRERVRQIERAALIKLRTALPSDL